MFIDEMKIKAVAGKGGDGVVRWLHEKGKEFSGPAGGDGGTGGDVYFSAVRDIHKLAEYRNRKEFLAERGEDGRSKSQHGASGEDLVIEVPVGSVITNLESGEKYELLSEGERAKVLRGGKGGLGNERFKSSTNQRPKEWTAGKKGEWAEFDIELELVVDVGFVGFPNAGKSSLLNVLTNASAKVAPYEFTTLEPNLGEFFGYILADIPGLIEGAAKGKGLGHKFLRHIKRTKMLAHLISLENDNLKKSYKTIRKELEAYDKELAEKEEVIVLSKSDIVSDKEAEKAKKAMEKETGQKVFLVSILKDDSVKNFGDELVKILRNAG